MTEIVPSEELRGLVLQWYRLWEARDIDGFEQSWTTSPSVLIVGSDEAEWLAGSRAVNVFLTQLQEQGDGFMLAFPSAAFALRACLVLRVRLNTGFRGLPVRVRIGLHVGEALRHADDFYGRTVVIAARISALALGGEILASDLVHALAEGLGTFTFGPPRTSELKGVDGTFGLFPVLS